MMEKELYTISPKITGNIRLYHQIQEQGKKDPNYTFSAIIRVTTPGYKPQGIDIRSEVPEGIILTANIAYRSLDGLLNDPKIQSISLPQQLHLRNQSP